ncbi:BTAD domain-containing putative transcriptional regulator [Actinacidiphila sp. bgisy160]|uniref:BTAD domain-containing putative transcriptional regulator n=1 Tax=Actinacidiphila sp. bgisy160 TaxID=3413796 RepID=UPI003D715EBE
MRYRYLILGATEARTPTGAPVPLGSGKRLRALLAALALNAPHAVSPQALIAEVWGGEGDEPPQDASGALQALVSRLRRALAPGDMNGARDIVASGPAGYRLLTATPDDVDLHLFERLVRDGSASLDAGDPAAAAETLESALALWRGPALADLPDRGSAAARAEDLRLTATYRRIEACLALGGAAELLPQLRGLVAEHPLHEPFRTQLIRALRATGRPADALAAYEDTRLALADRLGTDPGPELQALHAELLTAQPRTQPAAAPPRTGNLRARLTSFVGREAELGALRASLTDGGHRLVTLTGPGGSGKTRLSQEVAAAVAGSSAYPDGVWLAEFAPLDRPNAVPDAVLSALGRRDTAVLAAARELRSAGQEADPAARLLEHCAHRRMLLVLDNCEHVIDAAAALTDQLLAACPGVTVLATSREPLGLPGETVCPVEPLPLPTAHRLFVERAAAVRPGFDADRDHAEAVDEICRRLDGLPLAIELAAARLRVLTPRQIAERLDDRFRLLTGGSRTALPRQQTLRAVVDWSWDLLGEAERTALCRLSVFAGGCTLQAAEAVCGEEALELVGQLVDKSLVVVDHGAREVRYRLLETIHEYAAERAAGEPADLAEAARRHTAYFTDFARTADSGMRGPDQLLWAARLEADLDNVRAVLRRTIEAGDADDAIEIALAMGWFWWLRNFRDEAREWLGRLIAITGLPDDPAAPGFWPRMNLRLLHLFVAGDTMPREELQSPEVLALASRIIEVYSVPSVHSARFPGVLWPFSGYVVGRHGAIREHADAMVATCRVYGGEWELAAALMLRTHITIDLPGGLPRADADWPELLELSERLGDRWMRAQVCEAGAEMALAYGDYPAARADLEEALRLGCELGAHAEGIFVRSRLGELAHREGDDDRAEKLLRQAAEEAEQYGVWDARAYIRALMATILLRRGELGEARTLVELAHGEGWLGTPPPDFELLVASLAARVAAAGGDQADALAGFARALRAGLDGFCAEPRTAAVVEYAAEVLVALGDPVRAARLHGAADGLRAGLPRPVPEEEGVRAAEATARAALGDGPYERARAAGHELGGEGAYALLAEATV